MIIFFIQTVLLILDTYNTIEDSIKQHIFDKNVCDTLETKFYLYNTVSSNTMTNYYLIVWDVVTNNDIFKHMIQHDISEYSFSNRSDLLRKAFLTTLKKDKWDNYIMNSLIDNEHVFIKSIIDIAFKSFNTLHICHKKALTNMQYIIGPIKEIIKNNTCFILNNNRENIPLLVYKMCRNFIPHYIKCNKKANLSQLIESIRVNSELVLNAECFNDIYEFKNFSTILFSEIDNINNAFNTDNDNVTAISNTNNFNMTQIKNNNTNESNTNFWGNWGIVVRRNGLEFEYWIIVKITDIMNQSA
ncbi:putative SP-containing membrane protein [Vairimorpha necatrix]|uniref:SP-containing membrane protein n=1 Tax=Vairimorpha necatrix TaxID=6039 RepID=A0AAX4JCA6_9MICR